MINTTPQDFHTLFEKALTLSEEQDKVGSINKAMRTPRSGLLEFLVWAIRSGYSKSAIRLEVLN